MAPAKVPVEIVWTRGGGRRLFRLSAALDPERIVLEREQPLPAGEQASATFTLPGDHQAITAEVELGARELRLLAAAAEDRARIVAYWKERSGFLS
jgi:hypothetical protein